MRYIGQSGSLLGASAEASVCLPSCPSPASVKSRFGQGWDGDEVRPLAEASLVGLLSEDHRARVRSLSLVSRKAYGTRF
ncbi:hypothetical protein BDW72DRAFT_166385 [Aspergillus terricola var. indicus]